MPRSNVFVAVYDPDALLAGTSPYAPFVAERIQLYRYTSEAAARADSGGVLVTTFTIIAGNEPVTAEAGPYRFGFYDSGATATTWYRQRYADAALANFSPLGNPWQTTNRNQTELRDLIFEIGTVMGDTVKRGTATGGTASTLNCAQVFKSTVRDARWYRGSFLFIEQTTDGLAPQGEEALIASVDTATGIVTLDNGLSATIDTGDIFQIHAYAPPSEIIRCINRVRERMFAIFNHDIALDKTSTAGNKYPVPQGIRNKTDVYEVRARSTSVNTYWQAVEELNYIVEFDGFQGWIEFLSLPDTNIVQVRYERSFRDYEGPMTALTDVTLAPIEWLRKAAAWEVYQWVDESESAADAFGRKVGMAADAVQMLSNRYAPESEPRPLQTGHRERIGPRSV